MYFNRLFLTYFLPKQLVSEFIAKHTFKYVFLEKHVESLKSRDNPVPSET